MHDRRTNRSHYLYKAGNVKLKDSSLSSGMQNSNTCCPFVSRGNRPTQSANIVFEQFWFQTPYQLHHSFFSAANIQAIEYMHDSQGPHQTTRLATHGVGGG